MRSGSDKCFSLVHPCDKGKGPCKNDGVCEKDRGGFKCKCSINFSGDKCENKGKSDNHYQVKDCYWSNSLAFIHSPSV